MAMKVLHNTCNMCIRDLPDKMSSFLRPADLEAQAYISHKPHAHVTTIT